MTDIPTPSSPSLWRRVTALYARLLEFLLASCKSFGRVFSVFTEKQIGRIDTACWVKLRWGATS